jgi:hypothetical protein
MLVLALVLAWFAGGCASRPPSPLAEIHCDAGDQSLVRETLYFGRNRPTGGTVSDAEWRAFLDEVITPHFPAGLTIMQATGRWRGQRGVVEQERADIVTIFHPDDATARSAIHAIVEDYKRRFGQEAVLRERVPSCARF